MYTKLCTPKNFSFDHLSCSILCECVPVFSLLICILHQRHYTQELQIPPLDKKNKKDFFLKKD